ncbi:MAG: hypothetical protein ACRD4A_11255 [Candidatus Acidiferrales bacterium]
MARNFFLGSSLVLTALLIAIVPAPAYQRTLSSELVREAYFLGQRRDETTARFFSPYFRSFPMPRTGPHIALVEALTPYAYVVLNPGKGTVIDTEEQYLGQPPNFQVRVAIYSTPTYSLPSGCENILSEFAVRVFQEQKLLMPTSRTCGHLPGTPRAHQSSGTELVLGFETAKVASAPVTIDIRSPNAQHLETTFDLNKLK